MNVQLLSFFAVATLLSLSPVARADQEAFFTRDLPEPDHAEVMSVNPGSITGPAVELDTKQSAQLAAMVRAQKYTGPAGACDKLQYVFRFYANHQLVATEGICFHCGCLAPSDSDLHPAGDPLSFDTQTAKARALEAFLEKLFPAGK